LGGRYYQKRLASLQKRSVDCCQFRHLSGLRSITGLPDGKAYELNGVKFDGFKDGILLEAKGPGYANFVKNGEFADWFQKTGLERLIEQAKRQEIAAQGRQIQWHFAEEEPARLIRKLFDNKDINIQVIVTP
jgi:hypothetical protein